jgi:hypothetical protein
VESKSKKGKDLSNSEVPAVAIVLPSFFCARDVITAGFIEDFSYAYWMLVNDPKRARVYRLKLYSKVAQWNNRNRDKISDQLLDQ